MTAARVSKRRPGRQSSVISPDESLKPVVHILRGCSAYDRVSFIQSTIFISIDPILQH